jgi:hypothetical protein
MTLGLTNGTTEAGLITDSQGVVRCYGAAFGEEVSTTQGPSTGVLAGYFGITTDPTKSGVETSSSGLKLYFYVGETIQDANVIAASQVLTDVANLKGYTVGIPDYTAGIDWSAAGTYTAPSSGWIMGFIRKSGSAANATLYVNNVLVARAGNDTGGNTYWYPINIFIEKGQIYKAEYSATSIANSIIKFFPCKGVN